MAQWRLRERSGLTFTRTSAGSRSIEVQHNTRQHVVKFSSRRIQIGRSESLQFTADGLRFCQELHASRHICASIYQG